MTEKTSSPQPDRLVTLAIHTYDFAVAMKNLLARDGVEAVLHNVNLDEPKGSSGVRVRIHECDLPRALKIVETHYVEQFSLAQQQDSSEARKSPVLIPIDFSPFAIKACKVGFEYARRIKKRVVLLHAYMHENNKFFLPFSSDRYDEYHHDDREIKEVAEKQMRDFEALIKEKIMSHELPRVRYETILTEGIPEECILNCAEERDVSLIVMGTRGTSSKGNSIMGSVAAEVLDACRFPMLTIPDGTTLEKLTGIKHVVFFSNLIQQDIISFDIFARMFNNKGLQVTVVPIVEKQTDAIVKEASDQLLQYCANAYPDITFQVKTITRQNSKAQFERFVLDNPVDMMVIPNKKRNIFSRLFNPSIAHRLVFQSNIPLLVTPVG